MKIKTANFLRDNVILHKIFNFIIYEDCRRCYQAIFGGGASEISSRKISEPGEFLYRIIGPEPR